MDLFIVLLTSMILYKCALGCGEKITLNAGVIQSSDKPQNETLGQNCSWVIHTPDNTQLVLVFKEFSIGDENTDNCRNNYIQITDGVNGLDLYGKRLCGTTIPAPVISLTNVVHVNYTTTTNAVFQLKWKISDIFIHHNSSLSWPEAVQTCAEDGGIIAERSSFTDIHIQNLIYSHNVSDIWTGKYLTPWTWLTGCVRMKTDTLNAMKYTSFKANQQKSCQNQCFEYNFYGLKGTKCYCLDAYTGIKDIPADHCTDGCPGNHDERCGGISAITLYSNDKCWDKQYLYNGTISNTYSGRTCQKWTSDTPHNNKFHGDSRYPSGSENNASNYCRDPDDGDNSDYQWCYTTDPDHRWEKCTIPLCISPKASSTQYMCMAFRYIKKQFEAIQSRCDSMNKYVCRDDDNVFRLLEPEETWHTSREKCRHAYLGLADKHAFKESFHWAGYFRNFTVFSQMAPNKSPDYCYNMQKNNDEANETVSQCNEEKAYVCQKAPITCGEAIRAYNGNITYPSTGNGYGPLLHCIWTITVDTSIYDMTLFVDIEPSYYCKYDFLKIYHGDTTNKYHLLDHVCGQREVNLKRLNGTITIQFKSDMTVNGSGFNISWIADAIPTSTISSSVKPTHATTQESNDKKNQHNNGDKNATPDGVIVGICVGIIVVIAIVVVTSIFLYRRNKQHKEKRKETVSTIMTSNPDNLNTQPYDANTSVDTSQSYGNPDTGNLPNYEYTQHPDKSEEGIYEDEGDGNISTRETRFSLDPNTYHMLNSVVSKIKQQSKDPESYNDVYNTLNESFNIDRTEAEQENVYNHLSADQDDNVYNHTDTMNETQHQMSSPVADETYSNMTGDTDDTTYSHLQNDGRGQKQAVIKSKALAQGESTYSQLQKY